MPEGLVGWVGGWVEGLSWGKSGPASGSGCPAPAKIGAFCEKMRPVPQQARPPPPFRCDCGSSRQLPEEPHSAAARPVAGLRGGLETQALFGRKCVRCHCQARPPPLCRCRRGNSGQLPEEPRCHCQARLPLLFRCSRGNSGQLPEEPHCAAARPVAGLEPLIFDSGY